MTMVSIPGFAWCFGEDGHVELEFVATGECGDSLTTAKPNLAGESSVHFDEDHCGPCLDFYIQQKDATPAYRINLKALQAPEVYTLNKTFPLTPQTLRLVVGNLVPQPPPRMSQALLEHRTIVLLN